MFLRDAMGCHSSLLFRARHPADLREWEGSYRCELRAAARWNNHPCNTRLLGRVRSRTQHVFADMASGKTVHDTLNHVNLLHILTRAVMRCSGVLLVQPHGGRIKPHQPVQRH